MRYLTADQQEELRRAVQVAAGAEGLAGEIQAIYREVEAEIAARRPRCDQSGRCCRFDEFGHLLFVTTAELAVFMGRLAVGRGGLGNSSGGSTVPHAAIMLPGQRLRLFPTNNQRPTTHPPPACVYQLDNLCTVHAIRPFGCRIFFCDPTAQDWQQAQYNVFHVRLKQLHKRLGVPYMYVEWRQALAAVGEPMCANGL